MRFTSGASSERVQAMKVEIGLKARTGRAVLVAVGGEGDVPSLAERSQFVAVPTGEWAPYHAAEGLAPTLARRQGGAQHRDLPPHGRGCHRRSRSALQARRT